MPRKRFSCRHTLAFQITRCGNAFSSNAGKCRWLQPGLRRGLRQQVRATAVTKPEASADSARPGNTRHSPVVRPSSSGARKRPYALPAVRACRRAHYRRKATHDHTLFNDHERSRSCQTRVQCRGSAREGKNEDPLRGAVFKSVGEQHHRDSCGTKERQGVHGRRFLVYSHVTIPEAATGGAECVDGRQCETRICCPARLALDANRPPPAPKWNPIGLWVARAA